MDNVQIPHKYLDEEVERVREGSPRLYLRGGYRLVGWRFWRAVG